MGWADTDFGGIVMKPLTTKAPRTPRITKDFFKIFSVPLRVLWVSVAIIAPI
jgi:hypothetical protein